MKFVSTAGQSPAVDLQQAVFQSLAPDRGLYMPEVVLRFSESFIHDLPNLSLADIGTEVAALLLGLDRGVSRKLVESAINFDAPLVKLHEDLFCLELFHGPTLAFKDFGARFMAALMRHINSVAKKKLLVLVATSGDTGSAVASGFLGASDARVVILYPKGKVSFIQEQQLTTMGGNISAIEVDGTFDDCQRMVKAAFSDIELSSQLNLTSANSINIARLVPQAFYYVYAVAQLRKHHPQTIDAVFSVPSGNFGNLTAGLIAKAMGLPVLHFIASTNINDTVPRYLASGVFEPKPSLHTISNAMDVGDPSNFARMRHLYSGDLARLQSEIMGVSISDADTKVAMRELYDRYGYITDPHGAVAYLGAQRAKSAIKKAAFIFLGTAHPAKFSETVAEVIGKHPEMPERLAKYIDKRKEAASMRPDNDSLKSYLRALPS